MLLSHTEKRCFCCTKKQQQQQPNRNEGKEIEIEEQEKVDKMSAQALCCFEVM